MGVCNLQLVTLPFDATNAGLLPKSRPRVGLYGKLSRVTIKRHILTVEDCNL